MAGFLRYYNQELPVWTAPNGSLNVHKVQNVTFVHAVLHIMCIIVTTFLHQSLNAHKWSLSTLLQQGPKTKENGHDR